MAKAVAAEQQLELAGQRQLAWVNSWRNVRSS
jgi:hypothetical protein